MGDMMIINTPNAFNKKVWITASGNSFRIYPTNLQKAINNREIESKWITRDDAIAILKDNKDLLDLEMISQEEYDKIKTELTPIIKPN